MKESLKKMTQKKQKAAALTLMEALRLNSDVIEQFAARKTVFKSVNETILPLSAAEKKTIAKWEKETGCLVYHVICSEMYSCTLYNLLYASSFKEDCQKDLELIFQPRRKGFMYSIHSPPIHNAIIPDFQRPLEAGLLLVNQHGIQRYNSTIP